MGKQTLKLTGPATGLHRLDTELLARLDAPIDVGTVVLGFDQARDPVPVQLFRNHPTQIAMVSGGYAARLLSFRAHAVGARVQVITPHPEHWSRLTEGGPTGQTRVSPTELPLPEADLDEPVLRIEQGLPQVSQLSLGPWQTRVVVQSQVTATDVSALRSFDLVLLQRVPLDVVHPLRSLFHLPDDGAAWLPRLPDNAIAVLGPGRLRLTALGPTPQETALFGAPDRADW
jgi:hypothetical protein